MSPIGRRRLERGLYTDPHGLSAIVTVRHLTKERRWPRGTPLKILRQWRLDEQRKLATLDPQSARGSLTADLDRYLNRIKHLASWREIRATLRAWLRITTPAGVPLRDLPRYVITAEIVELARGRWVEATVAPKTINHRVNWLRHLYRTLDGPDADTPCDHLTPLRVPRTLPQRIDPAIILRVERELRAREHAGLIRDSRTRARFMVMAATGRRPVEVMRAQPSDLDLARRVWCVRDAKGGFSPGCYLNDDMLVAWRLFVASEAWGAYDTSAFARTLRSAGWPAGVRPYQARHSVGIELSERGADFADVAAHLGHARVDTTRRFYVPVLGSRLQRASESLTGRLTWDVEAQAVRPKRRTG